ncbi:MAG: bacteriochlorophyll 4-vinyl reductase [Rhodobacteraceae bacterium]|jgi:divinyl protochlorophyllide a 8-vinyl-reductase|nr:bacteriochlorophyll 4-vinyl reductase [Paracoccaceae bacterium]
MSAGRGMIGPNAVLQYLPVLERAGGAALGQAMLAAAGLAGPPSDSGLMPEAPAAAFHRAVRATRPDADRLAAEAGRRTADYILSRRIPRPARALLRALPAPMASPLLARAIAGNAWTFAGSGAFAIASRWPLAFAIADNPVVRGEVSPRPLCAWHAAVFERLFQALVDPRLTARETACCAMGDPSCRFEIARRA